MKSALLCVLLMHVCSAVRAWDLQYGYQSVFSPDADAYLLSEVNVEKVRNGPETFYGPNSPAEGRVTYHFHFDAPIADAYLRAFLWTDFFPETLTYATLYASKDGQAWQLLASAPYQDLYTGIVYNQHLPGSLMGGTDMYIQSRLRSDTTTAFAQFNRAIDGIPGDVFQFKATLVPEPSITALAGLGSLALLCSCLRRRR